MDINSALVQFFPCEHLISLQVDINRLLNDVIRQCPVIVRICLEPVACELLVKGRLSVSRLISVCRPEAGAVRCEHLVSEHDISVLVQTELKFRVSDDDTACQSVIRTFLVQSDSVIAQLCGILLTLARESFLQVFDTLLIGDIFVMIADLCLCGRCVDRFRQRTRCRLSGSLPSRFL